MAEGAWIFLSHSHKDYDQVSRVRNHLEEQGHHPLMFFLKCLSDDDEIDGLIRREIEARSWFILCKSANSRNSTWVAAEFEIIRGLPTKTYTEIDLDDPHLDVEAATFTLTRKASVFLSYARGDRPFAQRVAAELRRHDFGVFSDLDLRAGEDWQARIGVELENAARRGAILVFLSRESVLSTWQPQQVAMAAAIMENQPQRSHIVPIYLQGLSVLEMAPPAIRWQLSRIPGLDFSRGGFEENMIKLMAALRSFDWRR